MSFSEYEHFDALGLADLVHRREITALELLEEAIARAEGANSIINAIVHKLYDYARAAARAGLPEGIFTGVPYLVKDLGPAFAGAPMMMGSRACEGFVPDWDDELICRSKAAGLNTFGKTSTPEFGILPYTEPEVFGACRNPWDVGRTPGGSSGGSAAAVAAGIVPMAHGNDGGGSIRIPASCCGLFGLKPSRGRQPVEPNGPGTIGTLSVDHVLSRSVRDSAAMLDVTHTRDSDRMSGVAPVAPPPKGSFRDLVESAPKQLKVALVEHPMLGKTVTTDCRAALDHTARLLADLGHLVEPAAPPGIDYAEVTEAFTVLFFEAIACRMRWIERVTGQRIERRAVETGSWFIATMFETLKAKEVSAAVQCAARVAGSMADFMGRYDLVLTPTLSAPPIAVGSQQPTRGEFHILNLVSTLRVPALLRLALAQFSIRAFDWVAFTPIFNLTGQPAASVPLYWTRDGLPIGTQLAARYGEDGLLFQVAGQLERAQPWFGRRPGAPLSRPASAA